GRGRRRGRVRRAAGRGDRKPGPGRVEGGTRGGSAGRDRGQGGGREGGTIGAGRRPPRQHAQRCDLRRYLGGDRAADEGRRGGVGPRVTRAVHGGRGAPGTQGDRRRYPRDGSGELHPWERGRGAASDTALIGRVPVRGP